VLYKSFFDAQKCSIEESRSSAQYFAADANTAGGAGVLLQFQNIFSGGPHKRVRGGYIINDEATDPIMAELKFSNNPDAETFSNGIIIPAGEKLDLYPFGLISEIDILNFPKVSTATRAFRVFAT
tara:strand:+ start:565 stop:939 length:375 start_codon:yes stop_codon:yes gene_type:complete